ncbi:carbohydrate ABC transporter permease [Novosphingobium flavum]|uniref:Carbohydrate ABC transporter permease n=1 Tax=Novosphingobium flavum TaxID=1778672 RepID=A0A7X1FRY9_9SPHN|nr:carbohydrate ABC transporter permease [Novosphingobium flavum]MBC2665432.1 carbohydrate ABC transporter permease [Novosphingobium flavum]
MKRGAAHRIVLTALAWAAALAVAFPLLWTFITSFKPELEAVAFPPRLTGVDWTLENYRTVLDEGGYARSALNSVVIAGASTLAAMALAIPAAWAMAFAPTPRTRGLLLWMLSTKMLPPVGVLMPIYLIYRDAGLLDTRAGVILLLALGNLPVLVWMLYTHFREVPGEVLEAARLDGASVVQELTQVLLPLALPGLASAFLLIFTLGWNEAFWTLNLTSTEAAPLTAFMATFSSPQGLFFGRLSAASILSILPIVAIGWFCQRQLVRGLTFGAVK